VTRTRVRLREWLFSLQHERLGDLRTEIEDQRLAEAIPSHGLGGLRVFFAQRAGLVGCLLWPLDLLTSDEVGDLTC